MSRSKPTTVVLVLQGGGALGAYHIGAFQALNERGFGPDWLCGISIGAINAAILAGNKPADRLESLQEFWHTISWPQMFPPVGQSAFRSFFNTMSFAQALTFGQPHFFAPRPINPYFAPPSLPDAISFYDTSALRQTLPDFADFDLINRKEVRLSLGVTDVNSGEFHFFDNTQMRPDQRLGPEHVIASGSLPPGFPATRVGDRYYWDGGCISNTPLQAVLDDEPAGHTLAFVIDLWSASGPQPRTLNDALWRQKQIQYASRTAQHIGFIASQINLRHTLKLLQKAKVSPAIGDAVPTGPNLGTDNRFDIVHIIYRPDGDQIPNSDAEFSRASIEDRRSAGYRDMHLAIDAAPWSKEKPAHLGALIHRVVRRDVVTLPAPSLETTSEKVAA